ncbi:MAG TPA: PAS domain-containing sensor histidine kinase [Bacteroidales bacterium]|nr:PAS domain-containing sensor histidine kinase [Bacteroidales bacterium]
MAIFSNKSELKKQVQEKTAELEETRDLLSQITDTLPDVIYIINLNEMKVVYVTNGIKSFGYTPQEIYDMGGNIFRNLLHPDDYDQVVATINEMITFKDKEIRENRFRGKAADGEWRTVISRTVLFKNGEDHKPLQVLGIIQDITEKVKTEAAYDQEKSRSQELARINAILDLFVHSAAHDLKGPTGNLMLLSELLREANLEKKLELCNKIEPVVKALNKTVSALLDIVYLEREPGRSIKQISFQETYSQISSELTEEIKNADPVINIDFTSCQWISYIESFILSIFRNLISNSLKYRSDRRRLILNISSECHGRIIILQFTDNGMGLNPECFDDLFKPFTRFSSKSEGSGIGLFLINTMVTRNGGKIEVQSKLDQGATFRVHLVEY